jgi:hypothetical protein
MDYIRVDPADKLISCHQDLNSSSRIIFELPEHYTLFTKLYQV